MSLLSSKKFQNQSSIKMALDITNKFLPKKILIFIFGFIMLDIIIKDPISANIESTLKFYQPTIFYNYPIGKIILISTLRDANFVLGMVMLFILNYGFIFFLGNYYKVATLTYEDENISSNEIEKYQKENLISEVDQDNNSDKIDRGDRDENPEND